MKKELMEQRIEKAKEILHNNPYYQMRTDDIFNLLEPVFIGGGGLTAIECLKVVSEAMQSVSTWEYVREITKSAEARIDCFNVAWELMLKGDFPDCNRFNDVFFLNFECTEKSPMHLMFLSFVMGMDFVLGS